MTSHQKLFLGLSTCIGSLLIGLIHYGGTITAIISTTIAEIASICGLISSFVDS